MKTVMVRVDLLRSMYKLCMMVCILLHLSYIFGMDPHVGAQHQHVPPSQGASMSPDLMNFDPMPAERFFQTLQDGSLQGVHDVLRDYPDVRHAVDSQGRPALHLVAEQYCNGHGEAKRNAVLLFRYLIAQGVATNVTDSLTTTTIGQWVDFHNGIAPGTNPYTGRCGELKKILDDYAAGLEVFDSASLPLLSIETDADETDRENLPLHDGAEEPVISRLECVLNPDLLDTYALPWDRLMVVLRAQNIAEIKELIRTYPALLTDRNRRGQTALHMVLDCARENRFAAIQGFSCLMKQGAVYDVEDADGCTVEQLVALDTSPVPVTLFRAECIKRAQSHVPTKERSFLITNKRAMIAGMSILGGYVLYLLLRKAPSAILVDETQHETK